MKTSWPQALAITVLSVGLMPLCAQSYQSRFEQVKFDREGAGGSKAGVVSVDGATGAASVDLPLGPGIGGNGLRFTPAVRMRSTALSWTQTSLVDPNAYMGTPPFLYASTTWTGMPGGALLQFQQTTQTPPKKPEREKGTSE